MTETTTLAHISDVHLGPISGFHPRYWNMKRGLGYLNWHRGRVRVHLKDVADAIAADAVAQKPDHIAVTGDLANIARRTLPATPPGNLKVCQMDSIFELIDQIKERPAAYLGRQSLMCFRSFLDGWCWRSSIDPVDLAEFNGFDQWVRNKYQLRDNQSWDKVVQFYSADDASALSNFFRLIDDYRASLAPTASNISVDQDEEVKEHLVVSKFNKR